MKKRIICVGNPGAGKSTILNSLLESVDSNKQYDRFKSGVSLARGLTYQLDTITVGDTEYMDTPGLADVKLRKQAAQAIHDALQQGGEFQVVFVVTLEAGRISAEDAATVKLVLDSAQDITDFGVIFNKVSNGVMRAIENDENGSTKLIVELLPESNLNVTAHPMFMKLRNELWDHDDVSIELPEVLDFVGKLPSPSIDPTHVDSIKYENFDAFKDMMENKLQEMRKDMEMMRKRLEVVQARLRAANTDPRKSQRIVLIIKNDTPFPMEYVSHWFDSGRVGDGFDLSERIAPDTTHVVLCYEKDFSLFGCSGYVRYKMLGCMITVAFSHPFIGLNKLGIEKSDDGKEVLKNMESNNYVQFTKSFDIEDKTVEAVCKCSGGDTNNASVRFYVM